MGTLICLETGEARDLAARILVGRSPLAALRLDHNSVSREHAVIDWQEGHWRIRDLGSRNGVAVNGLRCEPGYHTLVHGDRISFGDEEESWQLGDTSMPPPAALARNGTLLLGNADLLLLPEGDKPLLSVQWSEESWRLDDGKTERLVKNGEELEVGGHVYELVLPSVSQSTTWEQVSRWKLSEIAAVFEFDRSEEFVRLILERGGEEMVLPDRAFAYTLLSLARIRAQDIAAGLGETEAGWVDCGTFADLLKVREEKLNLDVFRARRLLSEHQIADAARIVERRKPQQLRFGIWPVNFKPL